MEKSTLEKNGKRWFRTGDLAMLDDSGIVRCTGRIKDIIKRGGMKINSREVERILEDMKGIIEASMVPVPDNRLGERACLFYRFSNQIGRGEITEHLSMMSVANYKWPEYFVLENDMPMTPTGKIAKGKLVERAKDLFSH